MIITGKILSYEDRDLLIQTDSDISRDILQKCVKEVEIKLTDGRGISADQRKAIFATIRDISQWSGDEPEYTRQFLMWDFCSKTERDTFSLSNCTVSDARDFMDYLVDFCLRWDIPTRAPLSERAGDAGRYTYACIEHGKCCVCGKDGEIHHVDTVGANGGNRERISHIGLNALCLCRIHHTQAHTDPDFIKKNHLVPIPLDHYLCTIHNLNTTKKGLNHG